MIDLCFKLCRGFIIKKISIKNARFKFFLKILTNSFNNSFEDSDMMAKQAIKHTSKQKANEKADKKKVNKKANIFVFFRKHFRSGGEENERQMENNVSARDESL